MTTPVLSSDKAPEQDGLNEHPSNGVTNGIANGVTNSETLVDPEIRQEIKDACVENFRPMRVIVIGAGFSGIYCGIRIPERLRNVDLTIYEKNAGVGGTWFENRYPGCACDIPAHSYQYTFAPNPHWSSFYAPSHEIRAYLEGVVRNYSVDRFIKCSHKVVNVQWLPAESKWEVTVERTETGETFVDKADVVISARGALNDMKWPSIPGFESLKIPIMHSADWDKNHNFEGQKIGIIGGGSSAIQIIPNLQKVPGTHLSCFVRSKTWISRSFGDSAVQKLGITSLEFTPEQRAKFAADPDHYLHLRKVIEHESNSVHSLTLKGTPMQAGARADFTNLMHEKLAKKPEILKSLLPNFSVGCRRLTPGPGYLEALVEDNVDFIETRIVSAHETGVKLADGRTIDLDVLICATGFHASAPPPFPVIGRSGQTMAAKFKPYPESYLSLAVDQFPNYFMILGPNAAIGSGTLTTMMEMEGDYIIKCIRKMQKENIVSMEVQQRRVKDFSRVVDNYFKKTVYLDDCNSWYRANGDGKRVTGLWPGSALHAMETFRSPRWEDYDYVYEGEEDGEEGNRLAWLGNGWSSAQVEGGEGEITHFLEPELVDFPAEPLPEKTRLYQIRPFSY